MQTFEKTLRECQLENERRTFRCFNNNIIYEILGLSEYIADLTRELSEKTSVDAISQEKILVNVIFIFQILKIFVFIY